MIAQIQTVDPIHLKDIVVVGLVMVSVALNWITATASRRSQKREISFSPDLVSREQCQTNRNADLARMDIMEKAIRDSEEHGKTRRQAIYEEVKAARTEAAAGTEKLRLELKEDLAKIYQLLHSAREDAAKQRAVNETNAARMAAIEGDVKQLLRRMP